MEGLLALLPFALLFLLCPLMMLFMHRGQGGEHDHQMNDREELARQLRATKDEVRS